MAKLTPMMQQYMEIKERYKDAILFFRLGDFYEMFFDDALTASKELEITLTGRSCGLEEKAPMCGVPFHAADNYISRLVEKGYKVAICEQVEEASKTKDIVKRDVVRVITPGTILDSNILDEKSNNYLCCIYMNEEGIGISYVDISTGELFTTEILKSKMLLNAVIDELSKIQPTEIITNDFLFQNKNITEQIKNKLNVVVNECEEWVFDIDIAKEKIKRQFSVISLEGYGLTDKEYSIIATGTLLEYLNETQKIALTHINNIRSYSIDNFMILDSNTRRNLELIETLRGKSKMGSLFWVLDKTSTSSGARLLKRWIEEPLVSKTEINQRLDVIEELTSNVMFMDEIKMLLKNVYDIERLLGKIVYGSCNGRDLLSLKQSISILPELKEFLNKTNSNIFRNIGEKLDTLEDIYSLIDSSIIDNPPLTIKDGGLIKSEYNAELDGFRSSTMNGKEWLFEIQNRERNRTGIKNLKISFNKIFGYYIEVTKSNFKLVPDDYIRKQTLSNSERYLTSELKEVETKILGSEEKSMNLEYKLFIQIRDMVKNEVKRIQNAAKIIAIIDVLNSLAQVAYKNNYIRPITNNDNIIEIKDGRHPVVEKMLIGEMFVPNDTTLDNEENNIAIITGPNMAGKSTYMRQVALIVLMAHVGSYVPASKASISIVDRVFTRIGASDDLAQGQSTFMVEMSEVANILNNGTKNSLIILDEIGRGTSTFDGLSIAWAVIEYISDQRRLGAKTLFATHYHELTELENKIEGIRNYKVLVKENDDDIVFLRKIVCGGADRSYGIEVAKLAGVPNTVIKRANEILLYLEKEQLNESVAVTCSNNLKISDSESKLIKSKDFKIKETIDFQLDIFDMDKNQIIEDLKKINPMKLTPLDSINILYKLIEKVNEL